MIVVSDTSPLSNLAIVGHLSLLRQIYNRVLIPQAVADERLGRREAIRLGLSITGVLGVLLVGKHRGLIAAVKPIMNSLITDAGFRVSSQLYAEILEVAGEQD